MSDTLLKYIPLLNAAKQDYIVGCVQRFADRPDFHRGLLPFLPAEEAARCLQLQLEILKAAQGHSDPVEQGKALLGEKFIRQTISIFRNALIYRLSEDEGSQVIHLNTIKLKRGYGKRFGNKFIIDVAEFGVLTFKRRIEGMIELQMVSRNQWKVTCHKNYLDLITEHLSDLYGS